MHSIMFYFILFGLCAFLFNVGIIINIEKNNKRKIKHDKEKH